MAIDKAIDSTLLDAACAYEAAQIRAKTGGSAQIAYDLENGKGFGDAIAAIPSSGGATLDQRFGSQSFDYISDSPNYLVGYSFAKSPIRMVSLPNVERILNPITESDGTYVFGYCESLTKVYLPKLKAIKTNTSGFYGNNYMCVGCTSLLYADDNTIGGRNDAIGISFFASCSALVSADFTNVLYIGATAFKASAITMLVLRNSTLVQLYNINAFGDSPFDSSGVGGTLYVPNDLLTQYTQATNWSTILGYANNQIKSIESTHTDPNAPVDLTLYYADGTPISAM